jgi:hypothetical protein
LFLVVVALLATWLVVWGLAGFPEAGRQGFGFVTSIITLSLLFILNHRQYRDRIVTHIKLDELIRSSQGAHPVSPTPGPPTHWAEHVHVHEDLAIFQASPEELPDIYIHRL